MNEINTLVDLGASLKDLEAELNSINNQLLEAQGENSAQGTCPPGKSVGHNCIRSSVIRWINRGKRCFTEQAERSKEAAGALCSKAEVYR